MKRICTAVACAALLAGCGGTGEDGVTFAPGRSEIVIAALPSTSIALVPLALAKPNDHAVAVSSPPMTRTLLPASARGVTKLPLPASSTVVPALAQIVPDPLICPAVIQMLPPEPP